MSTALVSRVTGAAAVVSGLAICAASYVLSTLPVGCVGDQCDTRPQRPASPTADAFYTLALMAMVLAACGLGLLLLSRGRMGRSGRAAVALVGLGAVVSVAANVVQSVFFHGDLSVMPAVFLPAVAAVVLGFAVLMVVVVRARLVPLWAGVLVELTILLVPFGDLENTTVLLDVPFGLALAAAGVLLVRTAQSTPVRNREDQVTVQGA
jgi:hypothetical protein